MTAPTSLHLPSRCIPSANKDSFTSSDSFLEDILQVFLLVNKEEDKQAKERRHITFVTINANRIRWHSTELVDVYWSSVLNGLRIEVDISSSSRKVPFLVDVE